MNLCKLQHIYDYQITKILSYIKVSNHGKVDDRMSSLRHAVPQVSVDVADGEDDASQLQDEEGNWYE